MDGAVCNYGLSQESQGGDQLVDEHTKLAAKTWHGEDALPRLQFAPALVPPPHAEEGLQMACPAQEASAPVAMSAKRWNIVIPANVIRLPVAQNWSWFLCQELASVAASFHASPAYFSTLRVQELAKILFPNQLATPNSTIWKIHGLTTRLCDFQPVCHDALVCHGCSSGVPWELE